MGFYKYNSNSYQDMEHLSRKFCHALLHSIHTSPSLTLYPRHTGFVTSRTAHKWNPTFSHILHTLKWASSSNMLLRFIHDVALYVIPYYLLSVISVPLYKYSFLFMCFPVVPSYFQFKVIKKEKVNIFITRLLWVFVLYVLTMKHLQKLISYFATNQDST
jgi:hypothetical protein